MNQAQETAARIGAACEGIPHRPVNPVNPVESGADAALSVLEVEREHLHALLERLRDRAGFESVTFVTGVDHLMDRRGEPRFEVVHQLLSIAHNDRVRIRVALSSGDARLPSCVDLWPGAAFMERECFDMFGIVFEGHAGLKRLLMPEGYDHHPLRKDFPHQGIEPDRLYREWDRKRRQEAARAPDAGGAR